MTPAETPEAIYLCEDMFGRWSAAVMWDLAADRGQQTKSFASESACFDAMRKRWPDVPIEVDG